MNIDTLAITIVFIILSAFIAVFARRRSRDRCLKDFSKDTVTVEWTDESSISGRLSVENTGIELVYKEESSEDITEEFSYILYKSEFHNIQVLLRFLDELTDECKKIRNKELKATYHPSLMRRLLRKSVNVFKTTKDSVMDIVNTSINYSAKATAAGGMLASQDKYVSQIKRNLIGSAGNSFEPLLEKYIGNKVILEMDRNNEKFRYLGVLKDYTAEFIEILDVDYCQKQGVPLRKADMVIPRKYAIVRHLGEKIKNC